MAAEGEITRLLRDVETGREGDLDELMALVYADLERMAGSYLRKHYGNRAKSITLEPAALVNESFLKLIKQCNKYDNRGHFLSIASRMMLRVLIDDRRRRDARMRGGGGTHITLIIDDQQVAGRLFKAFPDGVSIALALFVDQPRLRFPDLLVRARRGVVIHHDDFVHVFAPEKIFDRRADRVLFVIGRKDD